jgi:hypothetical protein
MNPHTPKWIPTLGIGIPMDSRIFEKWFERSKLIGLKTSLHHWKYLKTWMSKMGLHYRFEYLWHKLWLKKGPKIKMSIWFLTIQNRESPWVTCVQDACHISLQRSWRGLQICYRHRLNQRSSQEIMGVQSGGCPNFGNFETFHLGIPRKMTFGCRPHGKP